MRRRYQKENIVYKGLSRGEELLNYLFRNTRMLLLLAVLGAVFAIVITRYSKLFFTVVLIGLGAVSMLYQRFSKFASYIGFELCMMATVLTARAYGPHYGAFTGFVSITAALVLSGNFKYSSFISVLTLPIIGLIVPFFNEMSLLALGLLMTLLYDIIILPLYFLLGSRLMSSIIFFITHMIFNLWVFSTLAPLIYSLMS